MRNIRRDEQRVTFLINGGDSRTSIVAIALVLAATGVGLCVAIVGVSEEEWIVALVSLLAILPAMFIILRWVGSGRFARYGLVFDREAGNVTARDRREGRVLWTATFDRSRLYVAQTRVQIGYISSLHGALVYGYPPQDIVEDAIPTERMTLLTIAESADIEQLKTELEGTGA